MELMDFVPSATIDWIGVFDFEPIFKSENILHISIVLRSVTLSLFSCFIA